MIRGPRFTTPDNLHGESPTVTDRGALDRGATGGRPVHPWDGGVVDAAVRAAGRSRRPAAPSGRRLVGEPGHQVQRHVDAGRDTGRHDQVVLLDPAPDVVLRAQVRQDARVRPVGGGVAALQEADRAEDQRAGAHRRHQIWPRRRPCARSRGSPGRSWPGWSAEHGQARVDHEGDDLFPDRSEPVARAASRQRSIRASSSSSFPGCIRPNGGWGSYSVNSCAVRVPEIFSRVFRASNAMSMLAVPPAAVSSRPSSPHRPWLRAPLSAVFSSPGSIAGSVSRRGVPSGAGRGRPGTPRPRRRSRAGRSPGCAATPARRSTGRGRR
jgi:hypothetical protein